MDPGIFARVVGVHAQLVEKNPDNFCSLQLILQRGPNCYLKETIIFPRVQAGGKKCQGSNLSKVMEPDCFFL